MKIRQSSPTPEPSWRKALISSGASLLYLLFCPLLLLAAEQPGGELSAGALPSAIPPALTGNQEALSLTFTIFKTLGSLSLVIGLMLLLLFWLRKMGLAQGCSRQEGLIAVLDSQMLAPKKQVSVLEVAGTYLVVGLSEQQITLLATLAPNDRLNDTARLRKTFTPLPTSFAALLNKAAQGISDLKLKKEPPAHAE
ncbi:MAG: flagellar biosynthetic protein FliO [Deltaproteobacteria bacterium RIFOXYD12_FULL_55_16]|nr:MAG: flagellar biosynthetic protein FliO [Deltaproteobacteria bacterium RIFOXYD12_FULL_55_16]